MCVVNKKQEDSSSYCIQTLHACYPCVVEHFSQVIIKMAIFVTASFIVLGWKITLMPVLCLCVCMYIYLLIYTLSNVVLHTFSKYCCSLNTLNKYSIFSRSCIFQCSSSNFFYLKNFFCSVLNLILRFLSSANLVPTLINLYLILFCILVYINNCCNFNMYLIYLYMYTK